MDYILAVLGGYTLGSVPVSRFVARRHGVDLDLVGDRNPGAWNTLEQLGPRRALPAFLGDGAKGLVAGGLGRALGDWWYGWAGVAGAMLGHAFPALAPAKGGKSVMTFVGGSFALSPAPACVALAVCGAGTAASSFKWGARAAIFGFPAIQLLFEPVERVMATGALMGSIAVLFGIGILRRRSARATSAPDAARTP